MKNLLLLTGLLLMSTGAYARAGQDKGNGGDTCENKFVEVRDDIKQWLKNGGSKNLSLPKSISSSVYLNKMNRQLTDAKVSCTEDRLFVGKAEKTCKNFINQGTSRIVCNSRLFLDTSAEEQYVLVHHEYAGLAGFETNNGNESSNYTISNQLSGYLEEKVVKKLAVKIEETLETKTLKKFLADANNPKSALGAELVRINKEPIDGRNPDGIISFPITRDDIKIVALNYDENYNPWHYGEKSKNNKVCTASGDQAQYLILLATNMNYHYGVGKKAIKFTTAVEEVLVAKAKDNSSIEYCEDIVENGRSYIEMPTTYKISPFKLIDIDIESEQ